MLKNDFEIITHEIKTTKDIIIYPVSDLHLGAQECKRREWERFCKFMLDQENAYLILNGDLMNNTTRNSVGDIFDETLRPREQKKLLINMLKPLSGKILSADDGNHEHRSTKDADDYPMYDIMCELGIEHLYRQNIAFVKIKINNEMVGKSHSPTYMLTVTHGSGGGMLTGGAVNKAERFGYTLDGSDALIVGHTHKPFVTSPAKLKIDPHNNKVTEQTFKVINTSSWLGYSSYAARRMMPPTSNVPQFMILKANKKCIRVET